MLRVDYSTTYGEVKVKNLDGSTVKVQIHPANALCALGEITEITKKEYDTIS